MAISAGVPKKDITTGNCSCPDPFFSGPDVSYFGKVCVDGVQYDSACKAAALAGKFESPEKASVTTAVAPKSWQNSECKCDAIVDSKMDPDSMLYDPLFPNSEAVCADGKTFPSECHAKKAGFVKFSESACPDPCSQLNPVCVEGVQFDNICAAIKEGKLLMLQTAEISEDKPPSEKGVEKVHRSLADKHDSTANSAGVAMNTDHAVLKETTTKKGKQSPYPPGFHDELPMFEDPFDILKIGGNPYEVPPLPKSNPFSLDPKIIHQKLRFGGGMNWQLGMCHCKETGPAVCTADGVTYKNKCKALSAGFSKYKIGACDCGADNKNPGNAVCGAGVEYPSECEAVAAGVPKSEIRKGKCICPAAIAGLKVGEFTDVHCDLSAKTVYPTFCHAKSASFEKNIEMENVARGLCPCDGFDLAMPVCADGVEFPHACAAVNAGIALSEVKEGRCDCSKALKKPHCAGGKEDFASDCKARAAGFSFDTIIPGSCEACEKEDTGNPTCCNGVDYESECLAKQAGCSDSDLAAGKELKPVCVNGVQYDNKCLAEAAVKGVAISSGECSCAPGDATICAAGKQYDSVCAAIADGATPEEIAEGSSDDPFCFGEKTYKNRCHAIMDIPENSETPDELQKGACTPGCVDDKQCVLLAGMNMLDSLEGGGLTFFCTQFGELCPKTCGTCGCGVGEIPFGQTKGCKLLSPEEDAEPYVCTSADAPFCCMFPIAVPESRACIPCSETVHKISSGPGISAGGESQEYYKKGSCETRAKAPGNFLAEGFREAGKRLLHKRHHHKKHRHSAGKGRAFLMKSSGSGK